MAKHPQLRKAKKSRKSTARPGNPRKKLIKKLDNLVSEIVRSSGKCAKCGSAKSLQTHHAFGRKNMAVRWSMLNLVCLCYPCHLHWAHRNVMDFAVWFQEKIGQGNYDYLKKAANATIKWTEDELNQLYNDTKDAYELSKHKSSDLTQGSIA
jgi:hypothetical protein